MNNKAIVAVVLGLAMFLALPLLIQLFREEEVVDPITMVKENMTYAQVIEAVGMPDQSNELMEAQPEEPETVADPASGQAYPPAGNAVWPQPQARPTSRQVCTWSTGLNTSMVITFVDDRVIEKKHVENVGATLEQYQQIEIGMTYDQVKRIFGMEGKIKTDVDLGALTRQHVPTYDNSTNGSGNNSPGIRLAVSVYAWPALEGGSFLISFGNEKVKAKAYSQNDADTDSGGVGGLSEVLTFVTGITEPVQQTPSVER